MERLSYLDSHFALSGSDKDYDALDRLSCGQGNGPLDVDGVGPDGGDVDLGASSVGSLVVEVDGDISCHVVKFTEVF